MNRNRTVAIAIIVLLVIGLVAALVVAATGGDDGSDTSSGTTVEATTTSGPNSTTSGPGAATTIGPEAATTTAVEATTTSTPAADPLRILVTNDDGVGSAGIDALVVALTALDGVEVTVVAPAENQSGSSDTLSEGPLEVSESTTASGYPATAVAGTPGDTIVWAIDEGGIGNLPHVVVSGSNEGQNLGPVADVSGTVGAARTASRRGIPALAVSQGLGDPPDYLASVESAVDWVEQNREAFLHGSADANVVSKIDAPTCVAGSVKGLVEVPLATDLADRNVFAEVDCSADTPEPGDDIDAFLAGWVPLSTFDAELSTLQNSG